MSSPFSRHVTFVGLLVVIITGIIVATVRVGAQSTTHPDLWDTLEDGTRWYRVLDASNDTLAAGAFTAGYRFQMYADSTCETDYEITGFRHNGERWRLRNWKSKRIINAEALLLSFNSRTEEILLHTGDTLTFYRTLSWKNPVTNYQDTSNYHSPDTLTYSVELVRLPDSNRVALIDSIGVLPRMVNSVPIIHGTGPIMALVNWVVPATMNNKTAFLRVRVSARGSGDYNFTRNEGETCQLWKALLDPYYINYLTQWGQIYAKAVATPPPGAQDASAMLDVRKIAGSHDAVTIDFSTATDGGPTSVAVYDAVGRLLFYPYSVPASSRGMEHTNYRFESSGVYIISLLHDGRFVANRTITIGK